MRDSRWCHSGHSVVLMTWLVGLLWVPSIRAEEPIPEVPSKDSNTFELEDPLKPIYIVESIAVTGNTKTRGDLILSYLHIKPGEVLDEEKVELSRMQLLARGYFKDVRMRLERGTKRGRVKLVVEVEERNTIIVDDLFYGWSDTNPFWAGAGFSDINFVGRGLVLSGAFVASQYQQGYRLGVFWPSVFNTGLQIGAQLLFNNGRERNFDKGAITWEIPYKRIGGMIDVGLKLGRYDRIVVEARAEHLEADIVIDSGGSQYPSDYIRKGQSTLSSLCLRFEHDTRDDFFLPKRGMRLLLSIELASKVLGSDYEYSKYMVKYEHSFPAFLDHAVRISAAGGIIQKVGTIGSPFFSRFFVGDYALYWFDKPSLPRNLELNFSDANYYGDILASTNVEYDIPLWSNGKFFYRGYVYGAANFTVVDRVDFLGSKQKWGGRTKLPVTMDFGFKFDTAIGLFTLSIGYLLDMIF